MAACRALSAASAAVASGVRVCVVMLVPSIGDGPGAIRWPGDPQGRLSPESAPTEAASSTRSGLTGCTSRTDTGRWAAAHDRVRDLRPEVGHGTT